MVKNAQYSCQDHKVTSLGVTYFCAIKIPKYSVYSYYSYSKKNSYYTSEE